jgi:hypothetical protein
MSHPAFLVDFKRIFSEEAPHPPDDLLAASRRTNNIATPHLYLALPSLYFVSPHTYLAMSHADSAITRLSVSYPHPAVFSYTDKKENQTFLKYRKFQSGAFAKSYMTNGLLIYGEIFAHIRKPFLIYDFATSPH